MSNLVLPYMASNATPNNFSSIGSQSKRLPCPWTGCKKTYGRKQDVKRHIVSHHLPYSIFCLNPSCSWRGGREDDFARHSADCGPSSMRGDIYDTKLVLGYILEDGVAVEVAERFALQFVAERGLEFGKVEEWEDLCGRRAKNGWCRCDE
ncbi:hypothetical protein BJV78DRAFT_701384 [Lactifluus subvellereus]|nr:hypothetical protein BJV78DRAFT_701384 [Lactifluus subvellereus]